MFVLFIGYIQYLIVIIWHEILVLFTSEGVNCIIRENAPHPAFKRTIVLVLVKVAEELDESFLHKFLPLVKIFGVPHTYAQHFSVEHLVDLLLASTVVVQTTGYQILEFLVSWLHANG